MIHIYRWLTICALIFLSACGGEDSVEDFVKKVKASPTGIINKLPPEKEIINEDYTAEALRSPFDQSNSEVPVVVTEQVPIIKQQPRPDATRTRYFLEKYPLEDFIMVGTLTKEDSNWGLVQDVKGMVHIVKVGDYIGTNSGKIIEITPEEIRLTETVPDGNGGWMPHNTEITLKQD